MTLDLRASVLAGLLAALASLGAGMVALQLMHGNAVMLPRLIATIVFGADAFDASKVSDAIAFAVGTAVHVVLGLAFALLISTALHRFGFWIGFFGGALFGLALYAINTYTMSRFFPDFFYFRSWFMVGFHLMFGALCGGIYELLERDRKSIFRGRVKR